MATGAIIGVSTLMAGQSYLGYRAKKEEAKAGSKSARIRARYIKERNALEQRIAKEKMALEISMEEERLSHETDYIVGQLTKKERISTAKAVTDYAASGITVGKGGSAEAVLSRIKGEYESEKGMVRETADIELDQFTKSRQRSLSWFLQQSAMETKYGVQSSERAERAYEEQEDYAGIGEWLGPLSQIGQGAAMYYAYSGSQPITQSTPSPGGSMQAVYPQGPAGLNIQ